MACRHGLPDPLQKWVWLPGLDQAIQWLICSKECAVLIRYKDCTCIICSWAYMLKILTIILACAVITILCGSWIFSGLWETLTIILAYADIIVFVWFLDYFW